MSLRDCLDEDSQFFRKVESNSDICSNCYRRIRHRLQPHHSLPEAVGQKLEYTNEAYFAYFDDSQESGRPSIKRSYCECGFADDGKLRPFDKDEMMDISLRVVERLEEEGIEINHDVFFDYVREAKSDPDMQFNEEVIFEDATQKSIVTADSDDDKGSHKEMNTVKV